MLLSKFAESYRVVVCRGPQGLDPWIDKIWPVGLGLRRCLLVYELVSINQRVSWS